MREFKSVIAARALDAVCAQAAPLPQPASDDQAATLRRLFARPASRLLPVLLPELHCAVRASWVAKLAQGFARHGERVLVVDAARAQIASALGLRARFDLAQALRGECTFDAVPVDAGPQLTIVPAARALPMAQQAGAPLSALLPPLAQALQARGGCDLVLMLMPANAEGALARLPAGDVLVPMLPQSAAITQSLREIERIDARRAATDMHATHDEGNPLAHHAAGEASATFRLLFLGMPTEAAATLARGLTVPRTQAHRVAPAGPSLAFAGAARVTRDLTAVLRASAGWSMATIAWAP
ncbi:MAG: hypothetical protein MUC68_10720 [Burkholderiaceae bacterium]|jgi:hypothetical protein|nr:hypothetical protein [Burkholderiaceae bacterium]